MTVPELRLTLRALARQPAFTLNATFSLALGIGATTAIFSLLDRAVFRRLPVRDPDRLVLLYQPGPLDGSVSSDEQGGPSFSYPLFRGLQRSQTGLAGLAGARRLDAHLAYGGDATTGVVHRVSGNYFDVLGVPPALGRVLGPDDDRVPGAHSVAVLGYAYWAARWGSDPGMLNRTIIVNGHPFTIVGVAARGFDGERKGGSIDVFVPISMNQQVVPDWHGFDDRRDHWVTLVGRLRPGMTLEQAAVGLEGAYRAELEQDIAHLKGRSDEYLQRYRSKRLVLQPGQWGRGGMRQRAGPPLAVLLGMAALLLVMACTNVTSLQLARATAREREVAVRVALGASRGRVMLDLLRESLVLGGAAAVVGLLIAQVALRGVLALVPSGASTLVSATVDARILGFCLAVTAAATVLFGWYPALRSWRPDLIRWLKTQSVDSANSRRGGALRRSLVAAQICVSLVLVVCAGLLARSFARLVRTDLGIEPERLLTFSLDPKLNRYSDTRALALYDEVATRLRALPGVVLVSAARVPAIAGYASSGHVTVEGFTPADESAAECSFNVVGPDYFRTMGTPLVAGRELEPSDDARSPKVAVVNEAFVRRFIGDAQPLGRRFGFGLGRSVRRDLEIVGVVRDARYSSISAAVPPVYHVPYRQAEEQSGLQFYVRTNVDPVALVGDVRRTVAALDPHLPVGDLKTMRRQIADNVRGDRLLSLATGCFAGVACLLAAIGIYGVLAYDVARRTREIGVRRALGARSTEVRRLVLGQAARLLLLGVPMGLAASAGAGKLLQAVLVDAPSTEPLVYAGAVAFVVAIAALAACVPARRASRVDPVVALRSE
jgi:predicted permease